MDYYELLLIFLHETLRDKSCEQYTLETGL